MDKITTVVSTVIFIIGLTTGGITGIVFGTWAEKTRVKSFEEVIQMADQAAERQRQKLGNLEKLTAAERKQRDNAIKLFLKKYLPEGTEKNQTKGR